ncbi:MAG: hypothetical protein ACREEM_27250, partial [Blastocatellia bacterium]
MIKPKIFPLARIERQRNFKTLAVCAPVARRRSARSVTTQVVISSAASPPDVRKVFDLPGTTLFSSGLRPRRREQQESEIDCHLDGIVATSSLHRHRFHGFKQEGRSPESKRTLPGRSIDLPHIRRRSREKVTGKTPVDANGSYRRQLPVVWVLASILLAFVMQAAAQTKPQSQRRPVLI